MGSPFASQTTEIVQMGDGQTVTIRKLSGKLLDAAQYAHMTGVATGKGRNWATRFMEIAKAGTATEADAKRVISDPLSGYDRLSLVKGGITAWSYQEDGKPKPVTAEAIEDFDDEALETLAMRVLKLTKPALFQTPEEFEAARKNV